MTKRKRHTTYIYLAALFFTSLFIILVPARSISAAECINYKAVNITCNQYSQAPECIEDTKTGELPAQAAIKCPDPELTNKCSCKPEDVQSCKENTLQQGINFIYTQTWNCIPKPDIDILFTANPTTVTLSVPSASGGGLTGTTTLAWNITPESKVKSCELDGTKLDSFSGSKSQGETFDMNYNPVSSVTVKTFPVTYTISCINTGGIKYSKAITVTYKYKTKSLGEAQDALQHQNDQCYGQGYTLWGLLTSGLDILLGVVLLAIAGIFKFVLGGIINAFLWAINPLTWDRFISNPTVQAAWPVVKDFANIAIIIGIVLIAVATILRIKQYNAKSFLWKLIVVALLVNFSLVICGIAVDISNYLTLYFLNQGNTSGLSSQVLTVIDKIGCAFSGQTDGFKFALSGLITLLFSVIFLAQFIGLLVYAVIRVLTLWVCLILSPLAFVAIIFPGGDKIWNLWRDQFTKAIVNIPILAFTLWFVMLILQSVSSILIARANVQGAAASFPQLIAYAVLLVILAQATLVVANAIGAKQVNQFYSQSTKFITGLLTGGAVLAGKGAINKFVGSPTADKLSTSLQKFKPTRALGLSLAQKAKDLATKDEESYKKQAELMKNDKAALMAVATGRLSNPKERAAAIQNLLKGKFGATLTDDENKQLEAIYRQIKGLLGPENPLVKSLEKAMLPWVKKGENLTEQNKNLISKIDEMLRDPKKTENVAWPAVVAALLRNPKPERDVLLRQLLETLDKETIKRLMAKLDIEQRNNFKEQMREVLNQEVTDDVAKKINVEVKAYLNNTILGNAVRIRKTNRPGPST